MDLKTVSRADPAAEPPLALSERAAFWGLPVFAPTPTELAALKCLTMALNWDRYHCNPKYLNAQRFEEMLKRSKAPHLDHGSARIPAPYGFLALHRLDRNGVIPVNWRAPIDEKYFHFDKKTEHLGLGFLLNRKGVTAKDLIKAGCHPALFFTRSWSGADLPTPTEACSALVDASSSSSVDACAFIFGELLARCNDPAVLIAALVQKAHQEFKGVWSARPGIANSAEARATRRVHFAVGQLTKRKALPADLSDAWKICTVKFAALSSLTLSDEDPQKTFTDLEICRMEPLGLLAQRDDLQGFDSMLPLCGLRLDSDFAAGVPAGAALGYSRGKYWTTRLMSLGSWLCAARALELGDNPWLCAGDGVSGQVSDSNPFTLLAGSTRAAHTPQAAERGGPGRFASFALAFSRAALRDAETREPGRGRALCLEAFEASRKSHPELWTQAGAQSVLSACESALMSLMMEQTPDASNLPRPEPARPARSRL